MNTRLKHRIEDSRTPKRNIKLFPQKTEEHDIFNVGEELQQLPNGSFVPKKYMIEKYSGVVKIPYWLKGRV